MAARHLRAVGRHHFLSRVMVAVSTGHAKTLFLSAVPYSSWCISTLLSPFKELISTCPSPDNCLALVPGPRPSCLSLRPLVPGCLRGAAICACPSPCDQQDHVTHRTLANILSRLDLSCFVLAQLWVWEHAPFVYLFTVLGACSICLFVSRFGLFVHRDI